MNNFDDKILVSGANGHLGHAIVIGLLEKGYTRIQAGVREAANLEKHQHLVDLGIPLVEFDLLKPETLKKALDDVEIFFQAAAVYALNLPDAHNQVYQVNLMGTKNALQAARHVKKVILTSSIAAVGFGSDPTEILNEQDWNQEGGVAYNRSKVDSEKLAWRMAEDFGLNLVTICPGLILGPGFSRHTPSTEIIRDLLIGATPGFAPLTFAPVDCRDVAEAHILAYQNSGAKGRYIVAGECISMKLLALRLQEAYPKARIPKFSLPLWMFKIYPLFDWLIHKLTGNPRMLTRETANEYGGKYVNFDTSKVRQELGWKPRPLVEVLKETAEWMATQSLLD